MSLRAKGFILFLLVTLGLVFWQWPEDFDFTSTNRTEIQLGGSQAQIKEPESISTQKIQALEPTSNNSEAEVAFQNCFNEPPPLRLNSFELLRTLRSSGDLSLKNLHFKNPKSSFQRIMIGYKDGESNSKAYEFRFFSVDSENLPVPLPKLFETLTTNQVKNRIEQLVLENGEIEYLEEKYQLQKERYQIESFFIQEKLVELIIRTAEKSFMCSENGCQCI